MTDPDFDASVLSKLGDRLVAGGARKRLLLLLTLCQKQKQASPGVDCAPVSRMFLPLWSVADVNRPADPGSRIALQKSNRDPRYQGNHDKADQKGAQIDPDALSPASGETRRR